METVDKFGLCHRGIQHKNNHYACISENDCSVLLDPSKTMLTFNLEKIPDLRKHCDCIIFYREKPKNIEVYFVELKAIKEEYPDLTEDLNEKIDNSIDILSKMKLNDELLNLKIVKKNFVIVLLPKTIGTIGHSIKKKRSRILGLYKYDNVFIRKSGQILCNFDSGLDLPIK